MNFKERLLASIMTLTLILPCTTALIGAASNEITVSIDGESVVFDQAPIMENDRVLVPFRAIFEGLGATVDYIPETDLVTATKGMLTMEFTIGSDTIYRTENGSALDPILLDVPSKLVADRALVPVRAVSEGLHATVIWEEDTQTVVITTTDLKKEIANAAAVVSEDTTTIPISPNVSTTTHLMMHEIYADSIDEGTDLEILWAEEELLEEAEKNNAEDELKDGDELLED